MAGQGVHEFTDSNFDQEVLQSEQPVLVDFWAEWCQPCRMLSPTIDQLATEFAGKAKIGKVDTDSNHEISMKYGIQAIPTIMLFKNGQLVHKMQGVQPKRELVAQLQKLSA